jgi:tRNA A-37 threonylcarbamoyl transferase component Bud32
MAFSLKDYQIIDEIGRGGFASVYRARQKSLGREVAIKRLTAPGRQDSTEIIRFRREAEAMAALTHDNILAVLDHAYQDGNYYIVMEYVEGMAFDAALSAGLPAGCSLFVLEKVAAALNYAHDENIIHRDIKPGNILLGRNGQIKLADFGLAMFRTGIESITAPGAVLGTISFLAPEALASPKEVDARVDIFSFGCVMYFVLAGKLPFPGESIGEVSFRILNEAPPPMESRQFPPELYDMTMRCLEKDREKRPSVKALHDALKKAVGGGYHAFQEELIDFIRHGGRREGAGEGPSVQPTLSARPEPRKRRSSFQLVIAGIGAGALVIVAAFLLFFAFRPRGGSAPALPQLPAMNTQPSDTRQNQASLGKTGTARGKIPANAPAPMTGTSLDMQEGVLVIRGLTGQDTVILNDTVVSSMERRGNTTRIRIVPGFYRIEIRGQNKPRVRKEVDFLPYQKLTLDLESERGANAGNKPR